MSVTLIPHVMFIDYQIYLPATMPYGSFVGQVRANLNYYCNYHLRKQKVDVGYTVQRNYYRRGVVLSQNGEVDFDTIYKIYDYAMQDVYLLHELTIVASPLGMIQAQSKEFNTSMGLDLLDTKLTTVYWDIFRNYLNNKILYPYNAHLVPFKPHQGAANFQPEQTNVDGDLQRIMSEICFDFVIAYDVKGFYSSQGIGLNIGFEVYVSTTTERVYDDNVNSYYVNDKNYGEIYVNILKPSYKKSIFCICWQGYIDKKDSAKSAQANCPKGFKKDALINKEKSFKETANSIYGGLNGPHIRTSFGPLAALVTYMCRKVLYHARDMINMQNPGCCIFGNTDSVHLVLTWLTPEFI